MGRMADMTEEELQALYTWIDEIPLSRPKKNINRDFSDGGEAVGGGAGTLTTHTVQCSW